MTNSILGVVLAGGLATRMAGKAKGLQLFQGEPMCKSVIQALEPVCDQVAINANQQLCDYQKIVPTVLADKEEVTNLGPLSGIYSALCFAEEHRFSHVMFSPCDTPNITFDVFTVLKDQAVANPEAIFYLATPKRVQPLHGIWPVHGIRVELERFLQQGTNSVQAFFQIYQAKPVFWEDESIFFNINSLDELQSAE